MKTIHNFHKEKVTRDILRFLYEDYYLNNRRWVNVLVICNGVNMTPEIIKEICDFCPQIQRRGDGINTIEEYRLVVGVIT